MSSANEPALIDVRGLTKRYGDRVVVDHFDMRVPKGRIYGFLGPNGSGKTTTIRMLCGLLRPNAGEGTCMGYNIRTQAALIKREVGYMTQRFGLYEDLTIAENLDFIARVYAVPDRPRKVRETLERLGLSTRHDQLAGALSGGWKQRLALAACLIHSPRLLLLDEPTAGVDPAGRRDFWDQIHDLAAAGLTVLVSTHYMDEAERCHELTYIAYGKLLTRGTVAEVIAGAGLVTWAISGANLIEVAHRLRDAKDIRTVAPFGSTLHVSASSTQAIEDALATLPFEGLAAEAIEPSLEDVFIALMQDAQDNFSGEKTGEKTGEKA
ncbi:ABC transporter ATP-binding protein [Polaromonas sp.]|uniref:ABC transporter ATP-binding protein n=1 Tax=Polaromonas sp. TaxID=1869339 RepID=UPI002FC76775